MSALERCPLWRGLSWKVPKFKVRLFYTGPTVTRTLLSPYLTMGIWNGEKKYFFFCDVSVYLPSKVKVVSYFLSLSISDHNVLQLFSYHFQRFIYFAILILPGKTYYSIDKLQCFWDRFYCQGIINGHLIIVTFDIFQVFLVIVVSHYSVSGILTRILSPGYVFNINRRLSCYDLSIKIDVFCGRNISWKLFKQAFKFFFYIQKNQSIKHWVDFFETDTS